MPMEIQDVIHGLIHIPPEIAAIIRTPIFQRLRSIKQLGVLSSIILNANHTRFDHCVGTYFLATKYLDILESRSPWILQGANWPTYRLAVEVACLLHDIGHGPFSHTWEIVCNFNHEENAIPCVDAVFDVLPSIQLQKLRANGGYGISLVKALILGEPERLSSPLPDSKYMFIFEIVHNRPSKLDIDKWDYLKRDHYYLNHICDPDMDFDDIFLNAKVTDDGAHIAYNYRDYEKIYTLFLARWKLHLYCYRSPKSLFFDELLRGCVMRCNAKIRGKELAQITGNDRREFLQLTDERIMSMISNDQMYSYLTDVCKIQEVRTPDRHENVLVVTAVVKGAGAEMPVDSRFSFYGDISEKKSIERAMNDTGVSGYFIFFETIEV